MKQRHASYGVSVMAEDSGGFRDAFYGLAPHVRDDLDGDDPLLITSGLIDVGRVAWGERVARFARGLIDIVDAFFENRESPPNDPLQHLDGLASRGRETPQGARRAGSLRVVNVGAIRRFEGRVPDIMCDLDGLSA